MKYYIYISDAKVDMLLPQIPHETKRKIATEFKIDLKLLSVSRKAELDTPEDHITRLEAVCSFIEEYGNVGSVTNPDAYIFDSMPLKMLQPINSVYFTGERDNTLVALGGSLRHLVGNIDATSPYPHGSLSSMIMRNMEKEMQEVLKLDKVNRRQRKHLPDTAYRLYQYLEGPEEQLEFLAKRLLYIPSNNEYNFNMLLATPLYVSVDD